MKKEKEFFFEKKVLCWASPTLPNSIYTDHTLVRSSPSLPLPWLLFPNSPLYSTKSLGETSKTDQGQQEEQEEVHLLCRLKMVLLHSFVLPQGLWVTKVSWILPFPAQVGSLGGSLIMGLSPLVGEKSYLNVVPRISVEQFLQIFLGK